MWRPPTEPRCACGSLCRGFAATSENVELAGLTGEALDLPSEAFDAARSTWTLRTIPNVDVAL